MACESGRMNINDRLRAAYDEFVEAPEGQKPTTLTLSRKWRVNFQLIQGALAITQVVALAERTELEPDLTVVQPKRGGNTGGRAPNPVLPDQRPKVKALMDKIGFYETCKVLGYDWRQMQRVRSGNRALTKGARMDLERELTERGLVWSDEATTKGGTDGQADEA